MDTLQRIPDDELQLLVDLYSKYQLEALHVFSLLKTSTAWKKKDTKSQFLQFFGIGKDWLKSGSFILLVEYGANALFTFTLDDSYERLHKAITQTKMINWSKRTVWYTVILKHLPMVTDIVKEIKPSFFEYLGASFWMIEKEKALNFVVEIPDDVYLKQLDESHVEFINSHWPHKHENSEKYLGKFVELGTSYGLFLKSDDSLVCWILICFMGCLANLQTQQEHRKKGYAVLLARLLARKVAQEGYHPQAVIMEGNVVSERMFEKIGFQKYDDCVYVDCHP